MSNIQQEADYWRKRIASWPDEKLVRWIRSIARLKLRRKSGE